jgi:ABC-type iron transport system FetAB permease component
MKGIDKIYHFIAGFIISLIFGLINPVLGLALAIIAGLFKDVIWDKLLKKGTFEVLDIFFTGVGGIIGMTIAILVTNIA